MSEANSPKNKTNRELAEELLRSLETTIYLTPDLDAIFSPKGKANLIELLTEALDAKDAEKSEKRGETAKTSPESVIQKGEKGDTFPSEETFLRMAECQMIPWTVIDAYRWLRSQVKPAPLPDRLSPGELIGLAQSAVENLDPNTGFVWIYERAWRDCEKRYRGEG